MPKLLLNGKTFEVEIISSYSNKVLFSINNKHYLVEKANESLAETDDKGEIRVRKINSNSLPSSKQDSILYSDIPGLINSVSVTKGSKINQGETVLVIEAMKMQNRILAHKTGTIDEIYVESNQEVSKGQALIKII